MATPPTSNSSENSDRERRTHGRVRRACTNRSTKLIERLASTSSSQATDRSGRPCRRERKNEPSTANDGRARIFVRNLFLPRGLTFAFDPHRRVGTEREIAERLAHEGHV